MPCYSPLKGWYARRANSSGKRSLVFKSELGFSEPVLVSCGQCIGCRLEYSRQWAVRCVHEAQLHDANCFLTLTYRNECLPRGGTLVKKHVQDFFKRLRRRCGCRVSYFHCGEYGEQLARPHYHSLLFGYDFPDKVFFKMTPDGSRLYTSAFLEDLWPFGFATIGALTFESAAYVARYAVKKMRGAAAKRHYQKVDILTGEIYQLLPEYVTMSLNPAIAINWYAKFNSDVFPSDEVVMRGKAMRPPRFYDTLYGRDFPDALKLLKESRVRAAAEFADNNTVERLNVRRVVKEAQLQFLKREIG